MVMYIEDNRTPQIEDSCFSGLPGGKRNANGDFDGIGSYGGWWSSTQSQFDSNNCWYLPNEYGYVRSSYFPDAIGLSVRCLRD